MHCKRDRRECAAHRALRGCPPKAVRCHGDDQPQRTIAMRLHGIGRRGKTTPIRVKMIVADDAEPCPARGAMRCDQLCRIDCKGLFGLGGMIAGRPMRNDVIGVTEQQAASLIVRRCAGIGQHRIQKAACYSGRHCHLIAAWRIVSNP